MTTAATLVPPDMARAKFAEFFKIRFIEADRGAGPSIDSGARTARVIILTEGLGNLRDANFYMPSAVQSSVRAFEGRQFYIDHPSVSEDEDRPERSVRDLAGFFSDCRAGSTADPDTGETIAACFATLNFAESDPGRLAFDQVRTALAYQQRYPNSKDVYAGISINAGGVSHPGTIKGMKVNIVTEIREAFSADIVTKPARGGKFLAQARESVEGSRAGIAARVAAYQQRGRESGRPQRARMGRREDPMANTATAPGKVALTEAQRTALHDVILKRIQEAWPPHAGAGNAAPGGDAGGGDGSAPPHKKPAASPAGDPGAADDGVMDPLALAQDIQQDIATLIDSLPGAQEPLGGDPLGGAGEGDMGMGAPMGGGMPAPMTGEAEMSYACEGCGRENKVLPPEGYQLTKMGEVNRPEPQRTREADGAAGGHDALVERLKRQLFSKEERFHEAKGRERVLLEEVISLRAENQAVRSERAAAKALREAHVPADILSIDDLVAYHPSQWKWQITIAQRAFARETRAGGMGHRESAGGPARETPQSGEGDAAEHFTQNYPRRDR